MSSPDTGQTALAEALAATCNLCGAVLGPAQPPLFVKDGLAVVRCPACTLVFRRDLPSSDGLQEIYDPSYFCSTVGDTGGRGYADYIGEEELHRVNARRRLARLEAYVPPGRLLDVGCAAGFFLDEAQSRGWRAQGVELAPSMAAWARNRLGLDVHVGTFESFDGPDASFDAVTMWDYVEHSIDPAADFAHCRELVRPGGTIALSTGDVHSVVARISGARWHLLTPQHHNFFFSARTLRAYLDRAGFDVLDAAHPPARYSLGYLVYKLRTMADVRPVRSLAALTERLPLARLSLPVNLWDIVTVIARRR